MLQVEPHDFPEISRSLHRVVESVKVRIVCLISPRPQFEFIFQSSGAAMLSTLHAESFEKDDDSNSHIDFITAASVCL